MKHVWIEILAGILLGGFSLAQNTMPQTDAAPPPSQQTPTSSQPASAPASTAPAPAPNPAPAATTPKIAAGSVIPVQLTKTIDAKKIKTGDEVQARVTQDMKAVNGDILLVKDAKVVGHVVDDQPSTKEQKESHIAISFDHVVMKNGGDTQVPMSIQAIIAPQNSNNNNSSAAMGGNPATAPVSGGGMPSMGRAPGAAAPTQSAPDYPTSSQTSSNSREPINGNTQGVVGISNLKLSTASDATQGSLVTSEKGNVKLESGTLMLLKVSQ